MGSLQYRWPESPRPESPARSPLIRPGTGTARPEWKRARAQPGTKRVPCSAAVSARWAGPGTARRNRALKSARLRVSRTAEASCQPAAQPISQPPAPNSYRPKRKTLASIHFHSRGGFPALLSSSPLQSPLANWRRTGPPSSVAPRSKPPPHRRGGAPPTTARLRSTDHRSSGAPPLVWCSVLHLSSSVFWSSGARSPANPILPVSTSTWI
jgi:hypothetical protein